MRVAGKCTPVAAGQIPSSPLFLLLSWTLWLATSCQGDIQKQIESSVGVLLKIEVQRKTHRVGMALLTDSDYRTYRASHNDQILSDNLLDM